MSEACTWTLCDDESWNTDCGEYHLINDGTPAENNMRFCCYCGGRLVEATAQQRQGEGAA